MGLFNQGWTLSDLAGELFVRGIDIEQLEAWQIEEVLKYKTPERAAQEIEKVER